jgi:hypothetical protein
VTPCSIVYSLITFRRNLVSISGVEKVNRNEGEVLKYREARARTWAKSEPVGANDPTMGCSLHWLFYI